MTTSNFRQKLVFKKVELKHVCVMEQHLLLCSPDHKREAFRFHWMSIPTPTKGEILAGREDGPVCVMKFREGRVCEEQEGDGRG